jgi:tetratricopeptide (TPR) repeat protein
MLMEAHAGDVIIVTGQNCRVGCGKTYTVASALHLAEVRSSFYTLFWLNLGAFTTEEEVFGAVRILAVDVYFGLKKLISSFDEESESLFLFYNIALGLLDLESLESAENAIRSLISCTNQFLMMRKCPKQTPLLVLDGISNDRLLVLFRETGFTIVVTTRQNDLTEARAFPGCSLALEPLLPHDAFEVIGGTKLRLDFSQAPRSVKQLCSDHSSVAELSLLGAAALRSGDEASSSLEDLCQKRLDMMSSDEIKAHFAKCISNHYFSTCLSDQQSSLVSLSCVFNTLDIDSARWYMSLSAIPQETIFDLNFVSQLWGASNWSGVQRLLDYFVMLNLLVEVNPLAKHSMEDVSKTHHMIEASNEGVDKDTYWTSNVVTLSPSPDDLSAANRFYMLTALHADFLLFLALSTLTGNDHSHVTWNSWLSFSINCAGPQYPFPFHEDPCTLLTFVRRSCESIATFLTSKSLLMSLQSVQYVLFSAFWRRLEALKTAKLWVSDILEDPSVHCAVPYLQNRVMIEIELEGEDACLLFLTRACEVLERLEGERHYLVLIKWYEQIIELISRQPEKKCDFLGKAHAVNALGILYSRLGSPVRALDYHREALAIYRYVESESSSGRSVSVWKRISASNGIISVLENIAYALNVVIKTVGTNSTSSQVFEWKQEALEAQRTAVKMKLSICGSDSVGLAVSRVCLAQLLLADGCIDEAIMEFKMALDVFAVRLGTNHASYNTCRGNYGMALVQRSSSQAQYQKGVELIQESAVWLLRRGVKWDDWRLVMLRSFLPAELVSGMRGSEDMVKLVDNPRSFLFFW